MICGASSSKKAGTANERKKLMEIPSTTEEQFSVLGHQVDCGWIPLKTHAFRKCTRTPMPSPPFNYSPQFWLPLQSNKSTMIGKVILLVFAIAGPVSALWPKGAQECVYRPPGAKMWVSTAEQVTISNNGCIESMMGNYHEFIHIVNFHWHKIK